MSYKPGQIGPIRNANGATGNGRASVARGRVLRVVCADGDAQINYAAGHASAQNALGTHGARAARPAVDGAAAG